MGCPICRKATVAEYRPFCSRRCADVDLARWLSGAYVIAGSGAGDADEDGEDALAADAAHAARNGSTGDTSPESAE